MDSNPVGGQKWGKEGKNKRKDSTPCTVIQRDEGGPVGGDQSMAVLKEMNELETGYEEFLKSLGPRVGVR